MTARAAATHAIRTISAGAVVILLAGCGGSGPTQAATTTQATPPGTHLVPAADPSMVADCKQEPNLPDYCTQGDYQVAPPTVGDVCGTASNGDDAVWEYQYATSSIAFSPSTYVCGTYDAAHLPRATPAPATACDPAFVDKKGACNP